MTVAADGLPGRDRGVLVRWSASLLAVLALHAGIALIVMSRPMSFEAAGQPPAAVMIDLAPLPAPTPPQPAPPEPAVEQPRVQPPPAPVPPPLPEPEVKLPVPEPSPAPKPAVVLPKPPLRHKPKPVERRLEPRAETLPPPAAPAVTAPPAPAAAAPAPSVNAGASRANWQSRLVGWLERYKRYPRLAQEQRQQGVAYLRFAIDRQGRVLSFRIEKSSGVAVLDEEVLALIQRAQPLPAPPPEVPGERIELTVPVQFSLRDGGR